MAGVSMPGIGKRANLRIRNPVKYGRMIKITGLFARETGKVNIHWLILTI